MSGGRAAAVLLAAAAVGVGTLSGGNVAGPRTPAGLPGMPPPLFGTAVVGNGSRTAAIDAYGNVVDLRSRPAAAASVAVDPKRQAAGSTRPGEAVLARGPRVGGRSLPFWRADAVRQRYLPGSNVLLTEARFSARSALVVRGDRESVAADRRWLGRARPLAATAPAWARALYQRSLLVLRALTDRRSGAAVAGARPGWAYVWPRDAGTVALALASAGFRPEARRVVGFLQRLELSAAARFDGEGAPVPDRAAQGDAAGWVAAAAGAVNPSPGPSLRPLYRPEAKTKGFAGAGGRRGLDGGADGRGSLGGGADWRGRADFQEGERGEYLGNALAAGLPAARIRRLFGTPRGLVRVAGEPGSGLDPAAAWAVRPFPRPALYPAVRRTLLRLLADRGRFGLLPGERWHGGEDPWTAPTAWVAWALAGLSRHAAARGAAERARADRRAALALLADLRRAATPLGLLPERLDAHTGEPRSTTPLAWSHAFAVLTLRELWP